MALNVIQTLNVNQAGKSYCIRLDDRNYQLTPQNGHIVLLK